MKKESITKFFDFVSKNFKWIIMFACVVFALTNCITCSKLRSEQDENIRLNNNLLALNDTLRNYKDKDGHNCAEMRAMQLMIDELADSLKIERGKEPITIIRYIASIDDTIKVETVIVHDTAYIDEYPGFSDKGVIRSHEHSFFEKSSREMEIETQYYISCSDGTLHTDGESIVIMSQDIWLENVLYRDKNGYTYARLKTDYPGVTFNSGQAMLVMDPKQERKNRKQFGLGIGIHAGYGTTYNDGFKMSPYIGIGIGLQWNPRFLQF